MDICEGKITDVRESVSVHNGTSSQVYHFRIYKKQFRYSPLETIALSEGDLVTVAGEIKNGVFEVYAYKNKTVGVVSEHKLHTAYIAFSGTVGASLFIFYNFSSPFFDVFPYILGFLFLSVGSVMLFKGHRIKRAVDSLKKM